MPNWMTEDELEQHKRNAARHDEHGHRVRSWFTRAFFITPIGDLLVGKVWHDGQEPTTTERTD